VPDTIRKAVLYAQVEGGKVGLSIKGDIGDRDWVYILELAKFKILQKG
jgi:hypothetical protein